MTELVKRAGADTERDQNEERNADTEGVRLEASIPADLTRPRGPGKPQERKHLQHGRQLHQCHCRNRKQSKPHSETQPHYGDQP